MDIITIKNNKILEKKDVANHYILCEYDFLDDGTYGKVGQVLIDGVWQKDPIEQAQEELENAKANYMKSITEAEKLGDATEVSRLQAEWATYKDTCCYKSYGDLLLENDALIVDADKWFGYAMDTKGWWG